MSLVRDVCNNIPDMEVSPVHSNPGRSSNATGSTSYVSFWVTVPALMDRSEATVAEEGEPDD